MTALNLRATRTCAAGLFIAALLVGCGDDAKDSADDLCAQYDQLVEGADSLEDLDPDTATIDEIRDSVEDLQDQLDEMADVAEGRMATLVSALQSAVDDLVAAVQEAGQEARDTVGPKLEDTIDGVQEAWATLRQIADARCEEA